MRQDEQDFGIRFRRLEDAGRHDDRIVRQGIGIIGIAGAKQDARLAGKRRIGPGTRETRQCLLQFGFDSGQGDQIKPARRGVENLRRKAQRRSLRRGDPACGDFRFRVTNGLGDQRCNMRCGFDREFTAILFGHRHGFWQRTRRWCPARNCLGIDWRRYHQCRPCQQACGNEAAQCGHDDPLENDQCRCHAHRQAPVLLRLGFRTP